MEDTKLKRKKLSIPPQAVIDTIGGSGFYTKMQNGYLRFNFSGSLEIFKDGCHVSLTTGVKATYFFPYIEENDELYATLMFLLHLITWEGIGIAFLTKTGCNWLIFDTDRYSVLCKDFGITEEDYRLFTSE